MCNAPLKQPVISLFKICKAFLLGPDVRLLHCKWRIFVQRYQQFQPLERFAGSSSARTRHAQGLGSPRREAACSSVHFGSNQGQSHLRDPGHREADPCIRLLSESTSKSRRLEHLPFVDDPAGCNIPTSERGLCNLVRYSGKYFALQYLSRMLQGSLENASLSCG